MESDNKRGLLLGTQKATSSLYYAQKDFCEQRGFAAATYEQCDRWVRLEIDDVINACLMWAKETNLVDDYLYEIYPWLTADLRRDLVDVYSPVLFDSIRNPIACAMAQSWSVWYTTAIMGDVMLIEETDYRIAEWHRLTGTPE